MLAAHLGVRGVSPVAATAALQESTWRRSLGRSLEVAAAAAAAVAAVEVVTAAVSSLESSGEGNAGRGASVVASGEVELDAGVAVAVTVAGERGTFGSVGAVRRVASAVVLADAVRRSGEGRKVGDDATEWARTSCPGVEVFASARDVVTREAWDAFEDARRSHVEEASCSRGEDTVGAVVCVGDLDSGSAFEAAAATSSGGPMLRVPGEVGPAAIPRVGFDARSLPDGGAVAACVVSGQRVALLRSRVAADVVDALLCTPLHDVSAVTSQLKPILASCHAPVGILAAAASRVCGRAILVAGMLCPSPSTLVFPVSVMVLLDSTPTLEFRILRSGSLWVTAVPVSMIRCKD